MKTSLNNRMNFGFTYYDESKANFIFFYQGLEERMDNWESFD
jgi:hypothetical protein